MNHKGFSLIELIVTVSIITIMGGAIVWSYSFVNSANTTKCAQQIEALLDKAKIDTMSKDKKYYLVVYYNATEDGYYARVTGEPSTDTTLGTKIGTNKIQIYYRVTGEATDRQVIGTDQLELTFERATGGFEKPPSTDFIESIKITGSKNPKKVVLVSTTGKHYME